MVTGILFVSAIVAAELIHPYVFAAVFLLALVLIQIEFFRLIQNSGYSPLSLVSLIFSAAVFILCFGAANQFIPVYFSFIFFPFLMITAGIELFRETVKPFQNALISLFSMVYIAVPFSLLNYIVFVEIGGSSVFQPQTLLGIFLIIWVYDSLAYVFGSLFGKHKISEKISPKKSWEGVIGGGIFAVIMGILNTVIFQTQTTTSWIVISIIIVVFGTTGDFFESKIKRTLNVKDSGKILPGHGGLLDRFDSFLFAIPVVFFWLSIQIYIL